MDIRSDIQKLQDPEIKKILSSMYTMIEEKDKVIHPLQNRVTDLELRISEQERYSSKDCLIFNNAPITQDGDLWNQMASFINDFMGYKIQPGAFKACHVLGKGHGDKPPAVIIKFLYFQDKNEVYLRRPMLASKKSFKQWTYFCFRTPAETQPRSETICNRERLDNYYEKLPGPSFLQG